MNDLEFADGELLDALDCECISLEEAGLENDDRDGVLSALRDYWENEA